MRGPSNPEPMTLRGQEGPTEPGGARRGAGQKSECQTTRAACARRPCCPGATPGTRPHHLFQLVLNLPVDLSHLEEDVSWTVGHRGEKWGRQYPRQHPRHPHHGQRVGQQTREDTGCGQAGTVCLGPVGGQHSRGPSVQGQEGWRHGKGSAGVAPRCGCLPLGGHVLPGCWGACARRHPRPRRGRGAGMQWFDPQIFAEDHFRWQPLPVLWTQSTRPPRPRGRSLSGKSCAWSAARTRVSPP